MSSNWKFRKLAYDELRAAANSTTPDGELPKLNGSKEAVLQRSKRFWAKSLLLALDFAIDAIEAVCLNTTLAPDEIEGLRKTMVAFAKKAFSGRPKTQKKMESAFLALVEIGFASQVTSMLKTLSKERSPKLKTAIVSCLKAGCSQFGAHLFDLGASVEIILQALGNRTASLRTAGSSLMLEIHRWIKNDALKALVFAKLDSDTQKADIEKALAECDDAAPEPTRFVRGAEKSAKNVSSAENSKAGASKVNAADLLFEHAEECSILDKLDKLKFEKRIKAAKWSERRGVVQEIIAACGTPPKLQRGDYHGIISTLKGVVSKDSNQAVRVAIIQLFGTLASGLRGSFKRTYVRS